MAKTFADLAQKEGAIKVHEFKQVQFLQTATGEPKPEGKCYAFVIAYLTCLRTGLEGKDLLGTLETAVKNDDQAVIKEILGSTQAVSSDPNWMGTDLFNLQMVSKARRDEFYAGIGLEKEKERRFDDRFFRNKAVGQYIADTNPLYSIIRSRVHVMAATSHAYADRTVYTFFDPNFGEVVFSGGANLTSFVATFFSRKVINRGYRPATQDLKDVPLMGQAEKALMKKEMQSLILSVESFKETTPKAPPRRDKYGQLVTD